MLIAEDYAGIFGVPPASELELTDWIRRGIPLESVVRLRERGLTFAEMAETVISPRTLKHRKSRGESLSISEADRLLRLARILGMSRRVFGSEEKGLRWLRLADDRLHGQRPLDLLQTEAGGRIVESLLWQIDEGVYS